MTGSPITNIRTQKVRIKVLIASNGNYIGHGWQGASDKDPDETLYSCVEELHTKEYWIVAEIPIPGSEPETVEGNIEQ